MSKEITKCYKFEHPRLGVVYVDELADYPKSFRPGGAWIFATGKVYVMVDNSIDDTRAKAIEVINEAELFHWWPETV